MHDLQARKASIRPTIIGLAVISVLVVAGAAVVEWTGRNGAHRVTAGERPLELVPRGPGFLRVLANPWAEVWVDGQLIDTTPFARAVPLPPGIHYVVLKHPKAVPEKREVTITPGETLTLDVSMGIETEPALPPTVDGGAPRTADVPTTTPAPRGSSGKGTR